MKKSYNLLCAVYFRSVNERQPFAPIFFHSRTKFWHMPAKKATAKRWTKRFRRTKRSWNRPSVAALRGSANYSYSGKMSFTSQLLNRNSPFPPSKIIDLVYCDQINLNSATSTPLTGSAVVYRTGSIYDPDASNVGTNHQPMFFDQISGVWAYYQVLEFGWNLSFFNATTNTCFGACQITDSGDASYPIATKQMYQLGERPGCMVTPITVYGNRQCALVGNVKLWEVEGQTRADYMGDSDFQSLMGSNPSTTGNLSIAVGDLASPVSASNVLIFVKLIYKVRVWGLVSQSTS